MCAKSALFRQIWTHNLLFSEMYRDGDQGGEIKLEIWSHINECLFLPFGSAKSDELLRPFGGRLERGCPDQFPGRRVHPPIQRLYQSVQIGFPTVRLKFLDFREKMNRKTELTDRWLLPNRINFCPARPNRMNLGFGARTSRSNLEIKKFKRILRNRLS